MALTVSVGCCKPYALLMTGPKDSYLPRYWTDAELASVRGEINFKLIDALLDTRLELVLSKMRSEIETEMRARLRRAGEKLEFKRRCLFHASEINYALNRIVG